MATRSDHHAHRSVSSGSADGGRGGRSAETTALALLSYDEREALEWLLPRVPLARFDRVFAVDLGSTDGTLEVYARHGIAVHLQARSRS